MNELVLPLIFLVIELALVVGLESVSQGKPDVQLRYLSVTVIGCQVDMVSYVAT